MQSYLYRYVRKLAKQVYYALYGLIFKHVIQ